MPLPEPIRDPKAFAVLTKNGFTRQKSFIFFLQKGANNFRIVSICLELSSPDSIAFKPKNPFVNFVLILVVVIGNFCVRRIIIEIKLLFQEHRKV